LGTNPICFAIPSNLEGPLVFDMATSAAAAGKINVATARGDQVPSGWLIDSEGRPSTDPRVLKSGGALLPLGGTEGYKGTGLASIVEIFSGLLTGLGFGVEPTGRHNDGCFIAVFNVAAFRDLATFRQEVTDFAHYLKATPPAEGFTEVFYPGEIEFRKEQERRKNGVPIEDATWNKLRDLAQGYGLADKLGF
ncbi:MAG TPA: Ldh family oxidoreductase, partial [Rhodopila sp.]|nr:Ldh family oxidoreductase [Rhodopila sp.]